MSNAVRNSISRPVEFNYHLLHHALESFGRNLSQLNQNEYRQVEEKASRSFDLESCVITAEEASGIVISSHLLDESFLAIRSRYQGQQEFLDDLAVNGLDEVVLRHALYRELLFDAVMQRVASRTGEITELDAQLFYEMHDKRFILPERRVARHILITINLDFPENTRAAVENRMHEIQRKLCGRINRFAEFAKKYSECPTAMEGGKLGTLSKGQLYPELDRTLFTMEEGTVSDPLVSDIGMHLLYCEKIHPEKRLPFNQIAKNIMETLRRQVQRRIQKSWLDDLKQSSVLDE